jgi:hypothetical protein
MSLSDLLDRAEKAPKRTTELEVLFDQVTVDQLERLEQERAQVQADLDEIETDLAEELDALKGDLRNSDPRPAELRKQAEKTAKPLRAKVEALAAQIDDVNASVADSLVTFRFTALAGWEWADLTAHSMARDGVPEDAGRPYNLDEVCKIAATRSGSIVRGDTTEDITPEEWERIWKIAPASALTSIKYRIWYLNEREWDNAREAALIAARKASEAKAARTQPSPSASASHPAA